ncbi:methyl-accepting chemotaxis protein [Burkholderia gladioli]|uniref:Methyl-accepting chemotaxis protein n=1 Tax=Burkholderia gladioli TaxID=28095 RepID=A0A2A7S2Q9_BURGA|nr:methyl-accepting chemotaxis protein [Burkholderia gladioli]PEH37838.1 methyl-accepting chemotaxis protein [Burkholderia gladioli]QPQ84189.1 methyl-accepting chemotaxis protein [Burkholderia gladioli]
MASEVRKLADRSAEASRGKGVIANALSESASRATQGIEDVIEHAEAGRERAGEVISSMGEIFDMAEVPAEAMSGVRDGISSLEFSRGDWPGMLAVWRDCVVVARQHRTYSIKLAPRKSAILVRERIGIGRAG